METLHHSGHKLPMEQAQVIDQIHVLWITAGLGCDGDSIAMTAATQPSIEDIVLGGIPGIPKVRLYHPLFAHEVGEDFLKYFYLAEENQLEPFILVVDYTNRTSMPCCWTTGFREFPAGRFSSR